jgi:hypothetical protein
MAGTRFDEYVDVIVEMDLHFFGVEEESRRRGSRPLNIA